MATRLGLLTENNQTATSILIGRLDTGNLAGMEVLGVHFAGRQPGNVGVPFEGIFGTLQVDANGSFTYTLNNNDIDTNLLATGEQAFDRFEAPRVFRRRFHLSHATISMVSRAA